MSYKTRQRIEGHKKIIPVSLEEAILEERKYQIFNRHLVTDSETKKSHREWFECESMNIRQVFNLVQNLKRNGASYVIWYENYTYQDLDAFEREMKEKKESIFRQR